MAEYFYYFGFVYILHYIISLYDVVTFGDLDKIIDKEYEGDITRENIETEIPKRINKAKKQLWKSIPTFILAVLSWIWVIEGTQVSDEPHLFLGLIVFSLASALSVFIYASMFLAKNKTKYMETVVKSQKDGIKLLGKAVPDTKIFNVIDRLIRIGVVSYILYIHLI